MRRGIPEPWRRSRQLWIRIDSAGFSRQVIERCIAHNAAFSITCTQEKKVRSAIYALASDPATTWVPAKDADDDLHGSEIAETTYRFGKRTLRMILRRQQRARGEQLSFDDLDRWRLHAIVTNIPPIFSDAVSIEHHHRLRGGGPEEAIRQLTSDLGLNHALLESFFGN